MELKDMEENPRINIVDSMSRLYARGEALMDLIDPSKKEEWHEEVDWMIYVNGILKVNQMLDAVEEIKKNGVSAQEFYSTNIHHGHGLSFISRVIGFLSSYCKNGHAFSEEILRIHEEQTNSSEMGM